jgi:hypothetical protein
LDEGDRRRLICLVLFLIARDVAVREKGAVIEVLLFMQKLLALEWSKPARCCTNTEGNARSPRLRKIKDALQLLCQGP